MSFATVFFFILKMIDEIIGDKILAICAVLRGVLCVCVLCVYVLRLKVAMSVFSVWLLLLVCMPGSLYLHKLVISIVVILNV